jgi:hypothetical protein
VLAQRLLGGLRAVMSKIAPSSQRRPSPASAAWPRSRTERTSPSRRTIRYSIVYGRPAATPSRTDRSTRSRSSGWMTLVKLRIRLEMKSEAG